MATRQNATRMQTFAFWNRFWRICIVWAAQNKGLRQNAKVAFWNFGGCFEGVCLGPAETIGFFQNAIQNAEFCILEFAKRVFIPMRGAVNKGTRQNASRMQLFAFWNCFWRIYIGRPAQNKGFRQNAKVAFWILEVSIWLSGRCNHKKTGDHRRNRCLYMCGVWAFMAVDVMADWHHHDMTRVALTSAWKGMSWLWME